MVCFQERARFLDLLQLQGAPCIPDELHHKVRWWHRYQASNDENDGTWEVVDQRDDNFDLSTQFVPHNLQTSRPMSESFRFVRFRQAKKNRHRDECLRFIALELFGTLSSQWIHHNLTCLYMPARGVPDREWESLRNVPPHSRNTYLTFDIFSQHPCWNHWTLMLPRRYRASSSLRCCGNLIGARFDGCWGLCRVKSGSLSMGSRGECSHWCVGVGWRASGYFSNVSGRRHSSIPFFTPCLIPNDWMNDFSWVCQPRKQWIRDESHGIL